MSSERVQVSGSSLPSAEWRSAPSCTTGNRCVGAALKFGATFGIGFVVSNPDFAERVF
jgi:hypothetical protein